MVPKSMSSHSSSKKEGWEWDPGLAVLCRQEAQDELQRQGQRQQGDNVGNNTNGATEEDKEGAIKSQTTAGGSLAALSNGSNDVEQQQQPHHEKAKNIHHLPHYLRPRKKQKDYRVSALEGEYDGMLVPDARVAAIASAVPSALERERLFDDNTGRLIKKRIWKYNDGCCGGRKFDPDAPYPYEAALNVAPNEWAEDVDPEKGEGGSSSKDNTNNNPNHPWPVGCKYDSSVLGLCWAFFVFIYRKNRMVSWKICFYQVICALVPPVTSYLSGTGLIDVIGGTGTAQGKSEDVRLRNAALYAIAICVLNIFQAWLYVHYSNLIPVGGARTSLRDVLFRRIQNLSNPNLCNKICSPGACAGIIVDDVYNVVGIYSQFLTIPSHIVGILANIVVSTLSLPFDNPEFYLPIMCVILLILTIPILVNKWFEPECCILSRLNLQWKLRLRAIAGTAIPRKGTSYLPPEYDDDSAIGDNTTDDNGDNKDDNAKEKDAELSKIFHETAFVEKMRHWQGWKITLVIEFLNKVLGQFGLAVVTICAAYVSIRNNKMSVGNFHTLVTCVTNIITIGGAMGSFYTNLFGKEIQLKQITAIMNDKDIDFDGGVNFVEKYANTLDEFKKRVTTRSPNVHKSN